MTTFIFRIGYLSITVLISFFLVNLLDDVYLATWFVFANIQTIMFILNNSLSPNVSRKVTFWSVDYGFNSFNRLDETIKRIFLRIVILGGGGILLVGIFYIPTLAAKNSYIMVSWVVFCLSILMEVYWSRYDAILNGLNKFKEVYVSHFIARAILLSSIFILKPYANENNGLIFCVFVSLYFISNIIRRFIIFNVIKKLDATSFNQDDKHEEEPAEKYFSDMKASLIFLSKKSFYAILGSSLITKSALVIAPLYLSNEDVYKYGLSYQMFEMAFNFIFTLTLMATPNFIKNFKKSDYKEFKYAVIKLLLISFLLMLAVSIFIVFILPYIVSTFLNKDVLLSYDLLLLLSLTFSLQLIHSICGHILTVKDIIPFSTASLITGIFVLISSAIACPQWGIYGLVLSIFICQLLYNNWYWVYRLLKFIKEIKYNENKNICIIAK